MRMGCNVYLAYLYYTLKLLTETMHPCSYTIQAYTMRAGCTVYQANQVPPSPRLWMFKGFMLGLHNVTETQGHKPCTIPDIMEGVCPWRKTFTHCPRLRVQVRLKVKHNQTGTQCSNSSRFKLNCKTHGFVALWPLYLEQPPQDIRRSANLSSFQNKFKHLTIITLTIKVFIQCKILSTETILSIQQNKALCGSWALHCD